MISFSLPGLYSNYKLNKSFVIVVNKFPEYLRKGVRISSVYGCFPPAIWNGGRKIEGNCSIERVQEELSFFNSNDISCRYTFTNSLLQEKHLHDVFCNELSRLAHNNKNGVIINSPLLEAYIREIYPKLYIVSSTTKCITDFKKFEDECSQRYDYVVLDYSLNFSNELKSARNPEKIEILVNAYCRDNCPERRGHYIALSRGQLSFSEKSSFHGCPYVLESFFDVKENRQSFVNNDTISNFYNPLGIVNFKIEGRTNNVYDVLESYLYYLILEEYKDRARLEILKEMHND